MFSSCKGLYSGKACLRKLITIRLMDNAIRKAKESGEKKLQAKDVRKVTEVSRWQWLSGSWLTSIDYVEGFQRMKRADRTVTRSLPTTPMFKHGRSHTDSHQPGADRSEAKSLTVPVTMASSIATEILEDVRRPTWKSKFSSKRCVRFNSMIFSRQRE